MSRITPNLIHILDSPELRQRENKMDGATASALMGLMNPLLGKLSSLVEREYGKLKGVWREIDFLREELSSMKAALEVVSDLEEPSLQVKEWMRQVRELSYDVEDCINDFMYHLDQDDASDSLIHKISRRLKTLRARHRIANQITELKEHLEEVSNRQKRYEHSMAPSSSSSVVVDPRLPALFEEVDRLVGIKGPMDELIKWLTEDTDSKKQRKVISIVGFGGLGKTTLANQVYQQIRSQFDCTAFVSVSRDPIINKVLVGILTGLIETSNPTTIYQEQHIKKMNEDLHLRKLGDHQLITMIKDYLKDKRYAVMHMIFSPWPGDAYTYDMVDYVRPEHFIGRSSSNTCFIPVFHGPSNPSTTMGPY